jgi:hypothetical protein
MLCTRSVGMLRIWSNAQELLIDGEGDDRCLVGRTRDTWARDRIPIGLDKGVYC